MAKKKKSITIQAKLPCYKAREADFISLTDLAAALDGAQPSPTRPIHSDHCSSLNGA